MTSQRLTLTFKNVTENYGQNDPETNTTDKLNTIVYTQ